MSFLRKTLFVQIIVDYIFLGILISLIIITLFFWNEWGIKKFLLLLLGAIALLLRIASHIYCLKKEESICRNNRIGKIQHDKLAFHERQRINQQRDEITGQIDARLHKILTSNLIYLRMLNSSVFVRLFVFTITSLIFWGIFNFRPKLSLIPGLLAGFMAGEIWRIIIRYRIVAIFEKEFPSGSPERIAVIEHLNQNIHAYWFAPELLKVVKNY